MILKKFVLILNLSLILSIAIAKQTRPNQPELGSVKVKQNLIFGKHTMVVTNNPWSTKAAAEILNQGGNAADAAVTAGFVLGLTEPQSSGIGGGGYALSYNKKKLFAFDGRETAPHTANPNWFLDKNGKPFSFAQAMLSVRSVGVPSEVALFYTLSKKQGKLPWPKLLAPAIKLAEDGFPMSKRLYTLLVADQNILHYNPDIRRVYFTPEGEIKPVGSIIKNPEYAKTLQQIAQNPSSFYTGKIAKDIIQTINNQASTRLYDSSDLRNYRVLVYGYEKKAAVNSRKSFYTMLTPVCSNYRNIYKICSVPPSSSGGITVLELMKIYANKYSGSDSTDVNWVYNFLEASNLAFADRNQYLADPKFVPQPIKGLLAEDYIRNRSKLINANQALPTPVKAGIPAAAAMNYAPDNNPKQHGTTSIAIVDKNGNAITMTVTVEHQFGSHLFVDGFFLNNELADFSFTPTDKEGQPIANRVEAGKRPRSSIAPTMVFSIKTGKLEALTGSPGGNQIICFVAKNLIQMLDMHKTPLEAVSSANLCAMNGNPQLEAGQTDLTRLIPQLKARGESIIETELVSGETNIRRGKGGWYGAADPRREGVATGN